MTAKRGTGLAGCSVARAAFYFYSAAGFVFEAGEVFDAVDGDADGGGDVRV